LGASYDGAAWEREVRRSATPRRDGGISVLVTGAAGFVGGDCSLALRGQRLLASRGISLLLAATPFMHVLHLAAQAGVRYAMRARPSA
jgi:UDP-glucuronate 4-epimerase